MLHKEGSTSSVKPLGAPLGCAEKPPTGPAIPYESEGTSFTIGKRFDRDDWPR